MFYIHGKIILKRELDTNTVMNILYSDLIERNSDNVINDKNKVMFKNNFFAFRLNTSLMSMIGKGRFVYDKSKATVYYSFSLIHYLIPLILFSIVVFSTMNHALIIIVTLFVITFSILLISIKFWKIELKRKLNI